jgi:hypothetical protein
MSWKTIYIVGRKGFYDEVLKNLEKSGIDFMVGYNTRDVSETHELLWIPERMALRKFKDAITARTIFKYRLRFFRELEDFIETLHDVGFTDDERNRVERMRLTDKIA